MKAVNMTNNRAAAAKVWSAEAKAKKKDN